MLSKEELWNKFYNDIRYKLSVKLDNQLENQISFRLNRLIQIYLFQIKIQLYRQISDPMYNQVWEQFMKKVEEVEVDNIDFLDNIHNHAAFIVSNQISRQVNGQLFEFIWNYIEEKLYEQLSRPIRYQIQDLFEEEEG